MYEISEKYKDIADDIISEVDDIKFLKDVPVVFLACDKEKKIHSHRIHAECIKIPEIYRTISEFIFAIIVYEPNCENFDDGQFRILIEHELRHIGSKNGKPCIIPHDIERGEFTAIAEKYGENWSE